MSGIGRVVMGAVGLYPTSGAVLFCTFAFVACVLITSLTEDVESYSRSWTEARIDRTKHHFCLICQFVEEIDNCFGAVLLILTTSTFVRTINSTFYALVNYRKAGQIQDSLSSLLYMIKDLVIFVFYVNASHRIQREVCIATNNLECSLIISICYNFVEKVTKLSKRLRMARILDSAIQNQVCSKKCIF